jgi:chromosome segregation ATPase
MGRVSSQRFHFYISLTILVWLLLTNWAAYGQSLGDVARESREKKAAAPSTTPSKVITNADLPKDPDADLDKSTRQGETQTERSAADAASSQKAAEQRAAEQRVAERWKKQILEQENRIANLQTQVDNLKAAIHFVDANTTYDYYQGLAYNRYQARQLERLKEMQQRLDQQKKKLADMQEAARHAGMHTPVYDP